LTAGRPRRVAAPAFARLLSTALLAAALVPAPRLAAAAAASATPSAAVAPSDRGERWNVAEIYATPADFDSDLQRLATDGASFGACRGHLADDAATLRRCLELQAALTQRLYRLYSYATMRLDEDSGVAESLERSNEATAQRRHDRHITAPRDRVMVCMSSYPPHAATLLRKGSRMAGRLNTDWFLVYVETPRLPRPPACEFMVFDLGDGGATFLRAKGNDWLLDCGAANDYDRILLPYLRSRGVNRLDGLLFTHGSSRHIGGAFAAVNDFRPRLLADSVLKGDVPLGASAPPPVRT